MLPGPEWNALKRLIRLYLWFPCAFAAFLGLLVVWAWSQGSIHSFRDALDVCAAASVGGLSRLLEKLIGR